LLIQLRDAFPEIVTSGLAGKFNPGEYRDCYVPRFIAPEPDAGHVLPHLRNRDRPQRSQQPARHRRHDRLPDRRDYAPLGLKLGRTWHYTDPMHFEMARVVKVG